MVQQNQIEALVNGYRLAATKIDTLPERTEQEIGRAALRLNAASTLSHVATRAAGVSDAALAPLRQWVGHYSGGGFAEKVVAGVDSTLTGLGKHALKDTLQWALTGNSIVLFSGVVGSIAGVALMIMDVGAAIMTAALTGIISGGSLAMVVRGGAQFGPALAEGARTTWEDACRLGAQVEKVLSDTVLPAERVVWQAAGGSAHPGVPFVGRARSRAQWVVGGALGLAALAVLLLALGGYQAYEAWNAQRVATFGY